MRNKMAQVIGPILLVLSVFFLAKAQGKSYDVVKRFKLVEDKVKTHDMLTPFGHDFIFDLNTLLNKDLLDFVDKAKDASKTGETAEEKLAAAQKFLKEYDKTEQNVRIGFTLGFPLPSFTAWGVKIRPNIRANAGVGFMMGVQTSNLTLAQVAELLPSNTPEFAKKAITDCAGSVSSGTDVVALLLSDSCGLTDDQKALITAAGIETGKYIFRPDTTIPDIFNYIKGEARAGLFVDYEKGKHWFGNINIYGLGRADLKVRISADALAKDSDSFDLGKQKNTTVNLATDLKFGYKNGNLSAYLAAEEVKLSRLSDNEDKGVKLIYGDDPLFRLHGEYTYNFIGFDLRPFVGTHQRSGYDFADGLYGGTDVGFFIWGERIGVNMRGMIDNEHLTLSPMFKLWVMHLQYMLKVPVKSNVDGVKPSALHSVNFRLFF